MTQQISKLFYLFKVAVSVTALVITATTVTTVSAHDELTEPTKSNATTTSRFKIFTAEHEAITRGGKSEKIQSIFKIDLDTGTVWRYRQGIDQKGKSFEEFFEVPNQ